MHVDGTIKPRKSTILWLSLGCFRVTSRRTLPIIGVLFVFSHSFASKTQKTCREKMVAGFWQSTGSMVFTEKVRFAERVFAEQDTIKATLSD